MSHNKRLADYRMLHFAVHGVFVSVIPELSALVLSPLASGSYSKYLTVAEVARLNLTADFVNLSACETGLGKVYLSEGVVGLAQAFFMAGANSVCMTLWRITDKFSKDFMISVYRMIKNEGKNYHEAINLTKRAFIKGEYGDKQKHPYYWAPFVYYGQHVYEK